MLFDVKKLSEEKKKPDDRPNKKPLRSEIDFHYINSFLTGDFQFGKGLA